VIGSIAAKSLATALSLSVAAILVSPIVIVMGVPTFGDASDVPDGETRAVAAGGDASAITADGEAIVVADGETSVVADGNPLGPPAVLAEQPTRATAIVAPIINASMFFIVKGKLLLCGERWSVVVCRRDVMPVSACTLRQIVRSGIVVVER
jgi:hypothetical protein